MTGSVGGCWREVCSEAGPLVTSARLADRPAAIQAFIAGGVLLNVFSEELPQERQSRQGTFAAAALGFGALLVFL